MRRNRREGLEWSQFFPEIYVRITRREGLEWSQLFKEIYVRITRREGLEWSQFFQNIRAYKKARAWSGRSLGTWSQVIEMSHRNR